MAVASSVCVDLIQFSCAHGTSNQGNHIVFIHYDAHHPAGFIADLDGVCNEPIFEKVDKICILITD
jgi:hypothetical protein